MFFFDIEKLDFYRCKFVSFGIFFFVFGWWWFVFFSFIFFFGVIIF